MAAAAFSGPEIIKQVLDENSEGDGSFLAQVQTDGGYICGGGWHIYFCIITHRVWQVCTATLVTHDCYAVAQT